MTENYYNTKVFLKMPVTKSLFILKKFCDTINNVQVRLLNSKILFIMYLPTPSNTIRTRHKVSFEGRFNKVKPRVFLLVLCKVQTTSPRILIFLNHIFNCKVMH